MNRKEYLKILKIEENIFNKLRKKGMSFNKAYKKTYN